MPSHYVSLTTSRSAFDWTLFGANVCPEYNETQCDKRNTYRRKVKEEKAVAASREDGEPSNEAETAEGANGTTNGHADTEDEDRPAKKFKAEDGTAMAPDANGLEEDEMDVEQDGEQDDAVDQLEEDDRDDDGDEEDGEEEDDDEEVDNEPVVLVDADNVALGGDIRDEALDDPDSDSD